MKELIEIQTSLKAPKNREVKGRDGNVIYTYRSCEDILEAVKEQLKKAKCTITITDEVMMVGNRIYIKATATITNESGESVSASAFAREPETLGSMTQPQVTGSASSYARKYALNGLLAIDDTNDVDEQREQESAQENTQENMPLDSDAIAEIEQIVKPMVVQANSITELTNIYNSYPQYKGKPKYVEIFSAKKKELLAKNK